MMRSRRSAIVAAVIVAACAAASAETGMKTVMAVLESRYAVHPHGVPGLWLAKPFLGRGIMTALVQRMCRHAFEEFGLVKITAHVFPHNPASARVLEKCGFQQEGLLRKHFLKDGKFVDALLFALFK